MMDLNSENSNTYIEIFDAFGGMMYVHSEMSMCIIGCSFKINIWKKLNPVTSVKNEWIKITIILSSCLSLSYILV